MNIEDTIILDSKKCNAELLTIHADGRITVAEQLKPTETAALVLECMKTKWMDDAQSIKIRDQQEYIKRLEEAANKTIKLAAKHIKQLVDGGDEAIYKTNLFDRELHWNKAKEAKP
jgi:hypothetical protein